MTRPSDVHWLYHEVGRYFPTEWARFSEGGGDAENLVVAYDWLLNGQADPSVSAKAAKDWCEWEDAVVSLEPGWAPSQRYADPTFRMTFARLCAHYFSRAAWLGARRTVEELRAARGHSRRLGPWTARPRRACRRPLAHCRRMA
jgi:proline iminopeptidase